jgi:Fe-S cluster assembly protein SufB
MLDRRLKGYEYFLKKPMPAWGSDLSGIDFDNIKYFVRSTERQAQTWEDLPEEIKNTYEKLGIPEAERQRLVAGVAAQYESEVVYHQINEELEKKGVIFLDTDTALKEHPEIFKEYFGTVIPAGDNKFAALASAMFAASDVITRSAGVFAPSASKRARNSGSPPVVKRTSIPVSAVNFSKTGSMP